MTDLQVAALLIAIIGGICGGAYIYMASRPHCPKCSAQRLVAYWNQWFSSYIQCEACRTKFRSDGDGALRWPIEIYD